MKYVNIHVCTYTHVHVHITHTHTHTHVHSLQTSGRLMEFSQSDGKLQVHYSDRLVSLLREVRQLSALGLPVPAKVQSTAEMAQKFYRHGVILKQVGVLARAEEEEGE